MTATIETKTANAEKAARTIANRYVREGLIDRRTANTVLKFAVPFVPTVLAKARLNGWTPEELTSHFQAKLAEAKTPTARVSAEIYLAMWAGLQVDYAAHVASTQSEISR
jgi:hypothetical protein